MSDLSARRRAAIEFFSLNLSHCDKTGQTERHAFSLWNKFLLMHDEFFFFDKRTGEHLLTRGLKRYLTMLSLVSSSLNVQIESIDSKQTSRDFAQQTPRFVMGLRLHEWVVGQTSASGPQLISLPFCFNGRPSVHIESRIGVQIGILGHGCVLLLLLMHSTCTNSHCSSNGHLISLQRSLHSHVLQPVSSNS